MDTTRKSMAVWKPKVNLDEPMLAKINKFYNINLDSAVIGIECFSHPSLSAHECNPGAKLVGGTKCSYCNHVFGRVCQITCHLSRFCLMVFAYRLGIGGDDFEASLEYTSSMPHEELYDLVQKRIKDVEKFGPEAPIYDKMQLAFPFYSRDAQVIVKHTKTKAEKCVTDDYLTLSEAAKLYGCSYVNIYLHVKRGNLEALTIRGMKKVKKADVLKLMEDRKKQA